jgi:hypothetical protein
MRSVKEMYGQSNTPYAKNCSEIQSLLFGSEVNNTAEKTNL